MIKKQSIPLIIVICLSLIFACSDAQQQGHGNALLNETSPYLLQHAYNPVNWYPWGDEALKKAKEENKMLIISVGYAACHWCHVMEHESFEDTTVARIMNENFIAVKVDREERPDVDDVYMSACQLSSNGRSCGWPLNAFAMPDGRPVWAGTYFPKKQWTEILDYWIKTYQEEPDKVKDYAEQLTKGVQQQDDIAFNTDANPIQASSVETATEKVLAGMDFELGGRSGAPKFPMPGQLDYLLAENYHTTDAGALEIVETTLKEMAFGGIYDQIGGGFARYSTDAKWLVPHFEKMLYDNGQLVSLYANAFKATGNEVYKDVVAESLEFIARELTDKTGGFYSSLDADSEGEEGKFYVWKEKELRSILGSDAKVDLYLDFYGVKGNGNWEHGNNILHRSQTLKEFAASEKQDYEQLSTAFKAFNDRLMEARAKRVRPGLDDKILASWNALMLMGYLDAYQALGEKEYLAVALKNSMFIRKELIKKDFRMDRNFKNGKSTINAFLDDYALTIQAFIKLYQCTFDAAWLELSSELADYAMLHFKAESAGFFNYTSDLDPPLVATKKEMGDNVIPGSNSSMAKALYQLGLLLYNPQYIEQAKAMTRNVIPLIDESRAPGYFYNWLSTARSMCSPPYEVAILGEAWDDRRKELASNYLPNVLLLGGAKEGKLDLLKDKLQDGATMIYVCQNKVCKFPVEESKKALQQISK